MNFLPTIFPDSLSSFFSPSFFSLLFNYLITNNTYESVTNYLRTITDPKEKRKYKAKHFDYVTFSGTFTKRNDEDLIKHSLLMTIDLDHLENLNQTREMLG